MDNKEFKNMMINSYLGLIIVGIFGIIIVSVMVNTIKSVGYVDTNDNCLKYNDYNQCIVYK